MHVSMCSGCLRSYWDYNHDPLLDDNYALRRAILLNLADYVHNLVHVKNVDVQAAFVWACSSDTLELVKRLLKDRRVDPGYYENNGMIAAAGNGNLEVVKLLLSGTRLNLAACDNRALRMAASCYTYGNLQVVELLSGDVRVTTAARGNALAEETRAL
jgi:Ankyrin repeats (3 copies)